MSLTTITLSVIIGLVIGSYVTYSHIKYMIVAKRLKQVEKICINFPSIEDIATKILTMKIPLDKLPPDVLESIRNEVDGVNNVGKIPNEMKKENYFG